MPNNLTEVRYDHMRLEDRSYATTGCHSSDDEYDDSSEEYCGDAHTQLAHLLKQKLPQLITRTSVWDGIDAGLWIHDASTRYVPRQSPAPDNAARTESSEYPKDAEEKDSEDSSSGNDVCITRFNGRYSVKVNGEIKDAGDDANAFYRAVLAGCRQIDPADISLMQIMDEVRDPLWKTLSDDDGGHAGVQSRRRMLNAIAAPGEWELSDEQVIVELIMKSPLWHARKGQLLLEAEPASYIPIGSRIRQGIAGFARGLGNIAQGAVQATTDIWNAGGIGWQWGTGDDVDSRAELVISAVETIREEYTLSDSEADALVTDLVTRSQGLSNWRTREAMTALTEAVRVTDGKEHVALIMRCWLAPMESVLRNLSGDEFVALRIALMEKAFGEEAKLNQNQMRRVAQVLENTACLTLFKAVSSIRKKCAEVNGDMISAVSAWELQWAHVNGFRFSASPPNLRAAVLDFAVKAGLSDLGNASPMVYADRLHLFHRLVRRDNEGTGIVDPGSPQTQAALMIHNLQNAAPVTLQGQQFVRDLQIGWKRHQDQTPVPDIVSKMRSNDIDGTTPARSDDEPLTHGGEDPVNAVLNANISSPNAGDISAAKHTDASSALVFPLAAFLGYRTAGASGAAATIASALLMRQGGEAAPVMTRAMPRSRPDNVPLELSSFRGEPAGRYEIWADGVDTLISDSHVRPGEFELKKENFLQEAVLNSWIEVGQIVQKKRLINAYDDWITVTDFALNLSISNGEGGDFPIELEIVFSTHADATRFEAELVQEIFNQQGKACLGDEWAEVPKASALTRPASTIRVDTNSQINVDALRQFSYINYFEVEKDNTRGQFGLTLESFILKRRFDPQCRPIISRYQDARQRKLYFNKSTKTFDPSTLECRSTSTMSDKIVLVFKESEWGHTSYRNVRIYGRNPQDTIIGCYEETDLQTIPPFNKTGEGLNQFTPLPSSQHPLRVMHWHPLTKLTLPKDMTGRFDIILSDQVAEAGAADAFPIDMMAMLKANPDFESHQTNTISSEGQANAEYGSRSAGLTLRLKGSNQALDKINQRIKRQIDEAGRLRMQATLDQAPQKSIVTLDSSSEWSVTIPQRALFIYCSRRQGEIVLLGFPKSGTTHIVIAAAAGGGAQPGQHINIQFDDFQERFPQLQYVHSSHGGSEFHAFQSINGTRILIEIQNGARLDWAKSNFRDLPLIRLQKNWAISLAHSLSPSPSLGSSMPTFNQSRAKRIYEFMRRDFAGNTFAYLFDGTDIETLLAKPMLTPAELDEVKAYLWRAAIAGIDAVYLADVDVNLWNAARLLDGGGALTDDNIKNVILNTGRIRRLLRRSAEFFKKFNDYFSSNSWDGISNDPDQVATMRTLVTEYTEKVAAEVEDLPPPVTPTRKDGDENAAEDLRPGRRDSRKPAESEEEENTLTQTVTSESGIESDTTPDLIPDSGEEGEQPASSTSGRRDSRKPDESEKEENTLTQTVTSESSIESNQVSGAGGSSDDESQTNLSEGILVPLAGAGAVAGAVVIFVAAGVLYFKSSAAANVAVGTGTFLATFPVLLGDLSTSAFAAGVGGFPIAGAYILRALGESGIQLSNDVQIFLNFVEFGGVAFCVVSTVPGVLDSAEAFVSDPSVKNGATFVANLAIAVGTAAGAGGALSGLGIAKSSGDDVALIGAGAAAGGVVVAAGTGALDQREAEREDRKAGNTQRPDANNQTHIMGRREKGMTRPPIQM